MGLRRRSIRLRILLLILVPLLSLIGLYAFVADMTIGDATTAARLPSLRNSAGEPVLKFVQQVGAERRLAALYVAKPTTTPPAQLQAQEALTDKARAAMTAALQSHKARSLASADQKAAAAALLHDSASMGAMRSALFAGTASPLDVINSYGVLSDDVRVFMTRLAQRVNESSRLQAYGLFQIITSLDTLTQEDAIVEADLVAGSFPEADRSRFAELVALRRQYADDASRNLPKELQAAYQKDISPSATSTLGSLEDAIIDSPTPNSRIPVDLQAWGQSVAGMARGTGAFVQVLALFLTHHGAADAHSAYVRLALAGGLGLIAVLVSVLLSFWIGRGLVRQLATLRDSALALATDRLPRVIGRLRAGEEIAVSEEAAPLAVSPDEIGQVGQAFNTVQLVAIEAAVDQAHLRRGISDVFRNLARRSQSLLHRQLTLLDTMERRTSDPDELAELYRLDHLTTRMRRHAEGLIILSGAQVGRSWREPVRLVDVVRAAVAEVEEYTRINVVTTAQAALAGQAVADVIHMLAELIENATLFSPANTPVRVAGDVVGNGFAVEVEDRGLGMTEDKLAEINFRLANPPEFDLSDTEQLGLFVAGRLASRHNIKISMRANAFGGSTAIVLIPNNLIVTGDVGRRAVTAKPGDSGALPTGGRHGEAPLPAGSNGQPRPANAVDSGRERAPGSVGTASAPPVQPDRAATSTAPTGDAPARPGEREWATASAAPPDPDGPLGGPDLTKSGLPRRVRQTSLAPELRTSTQHAVAPEPDAAGYRSPEQTRTLMTSLQRGWEQGRSARPPADGGQNGGGDPLGQSRSARHESENGTDT